MSLGKTVGLMLRICQSIFHSGKLVVLDSGFCMLKGIIELKKMGFVCIYLDQKALVVAKGCRQQCISSYFADEDVGDADAWPGEPGQESWAEEESIYFE